MTNTASPIHIIYASTGGNTEFVMEQVAKYWRELGAEVKLYRSEQTPITVIQENTNFLFATSTWDHGTINPFFSKLLTQMQKTDLSGKVAAFIGMGDRRYEKYYFCSGMYTLKEVWEKNSGTAVGVALTIGREPYEDVIVTAVEKWAQDTLPLFWGTEKNNMESGKNALSKPLTSSSSQAFVNSIQSVKTGEKLT